MATYSQGTSLVFNNATYTVTNLTLNFSDVSGNTDRVDTSHLGLAEDSEMTSVKRPLRGSPTGETGKEISFDYIGTSQLIGGTSATCTIGGPGAISGTATIVSSSLTLAVNDIVRGSATLRIT